MLKKIWQYFSDLGIHPSLSDDETRRIRLLNRASFITSDVLFLYMIIEMIMGIYAFILPILIIYVLLIINFYFMERTWYNLAKYGATIVMLLCISYFSVMVGELACTIVLFVPLIMLPLVIFKEKKIAGILFVLMCAALLFVHYLQQIIEPELTVNNRVIVFFRLFNVFVACAVTFLLTFFFKSESENFESNIIRMKDLIADKNKEIIDSIFYARHIQRSILPPENRLNDYFPQSFVIYKPKDIVAGDFYFLEAVPEKNLVVFAACDCTGHGVPGAMVSVVCANALNRTVKEFGLTNPGKILDKTRELVIESFSKSDEEVNDGMDISLGVFDKSQQKLFWSGANNPLWLIRNQQKELIEFKGEKQPVGKFARHFPFQTIEVAIQPNDTIYLFTDGYADQFGGDTGKKFKYSRFKELLLNNQQLSMTDQKKKIEQSFESWKGQLEQVDDVCIIGIRLLS